MITVSPIKIGQYQTYKSIKNKNSNLIENKTSISNFYYPAIYFTSSVNSIQRPPIKKDTEKKLDTVYSDYKNKLDEISQEDIQNICDYIEQNSCFSKKEILNAMQLSTQFGNMDSLKVIGNKLNEHEVGFIPHNGEDFKAYIYNSSIANTFENNFGLNSSLYYCFFKKDLQKLDGHNIALFIDNNKLEDLEKLSKDEINTINNRKNVKFFILSGFENGINFCDRTKDLKKQTLELLNKAKNNNMPVDEAIDYDIINRCKNIGINPVIIKNKNNADIDSIYNQLKPKQISPKELKAVIDATAINTYKEPNKQVECVDGLTQYLDNTLEVYTPERISKDLKTLHSKINKQVKSIDKTEDDIIYIIPEAGKSYDLINYQYQKINNIPKDKFITLKDENSLKKINTDNKVLVILDDCSLSGSSLLEDENFNYYTSASNAKRNNGNIIFAPIYVSDKAEERINNAIRIRKRTNQDFIIKTNKNEKNWNEGLKDDAQEKMLNKALGENSWKDSKYCIIFPYMSPDNNSEFASNIAIFHNINYSNGDEKSPTNVFMLNNIKTFYDTPEKVYHLTNQILNEEDK